MKTESFLPSSWEEFFFQERKKEYFSSLMEEVDRRYEEEMVFPKKEEIFHALSITPFENVEVVILGQDPYHEQNQANGLAFSISKGCPFPPSLKNIFKELNFEYGYSIPKKNGDLTAWADQGVLLLNATLTVKEGMANSHSKIGWANFTDDLISFLDEKKDGVVFMLWGNFAFEKAKLIKNPKSRIVHCAHPSPLSASRGFFHSDCFKKCNAFLMELSKNKVNWKIED